MKRRFLQIIPEIQSGGAEYIVFETARAIIENNDECFIFTNGGRMQNQFEAIGAKIIIGDAKSKNPFKILGTNISAIKKIIAENKIDLIHAHSRAPMISAYYAARATKTPLVSTYHGIYPAKNAIKRIYNGFMTKADFIIANSNFTKQNIIDEHHPEIAKLRTIYCAIDLEKFNPSRFDENEKSAQRKIWQIGQNEKIILMPARLTAWKGQKVLIEAASILKQKNINPHFVLMGDAQGRDDYESQLRNLISNFGLENKVHIVGHSNNVALALASCDIIALPSTKAEAFGLSAVESQAMGKITIASRLGASVETIEDGKSGYLFTPNDANDLAQKIETALLLDSNTIEKMAQFAIGRTKNLFDSKILHQETLKVYDELLKTK